MAGWLAVTMILLGRETAVLAELQRWLVVEMRWCSPVQPRAVGSCNGDLGMTAATSRDDGGDLLRLTGMRNRRQAQVTDGQRALVAQPRGEAGESR